MSLTPGQVFSIPTSKGFGFLQYIEPHELQIDLVRVLEPIKEDKNIQQAEINLKERWLTGFPLKSAKKRKIVEKIGDFAIPSGFEIPDLMRSKHMVRGEFKGWYIVNRRTLQRELVKELTPEILALSPHGAMNDELIIERLEHNWRLENWK